MVVKKAIIIGLAGLSSMINKPKSKPKSKRSVISVIDNNKKNNEEILAVSIINGNWDKSIAHVMTNNPTNTDWVGIYGLYEEPGEDSAYRFGYINSNGIAVLNKGTEKLDKGEKLKPGRYIIYLFADDSYDILYSKLIYIE